jgi:hypothetical protein
VAAWDTRLSIHTVRSEGAGWREEAAMTDRSRHNPDARWVRTGPQAAAPADTGWLPGADATPPQRDAGERADTGARATAPSLIVAAGLAHAVPGRPVDAVAVPRRLPLTPVHDTVAEPTLYCTTVMNNRGRLADRTPLRVLGWGPDTTVTVTAAPGTGVIAIRRGGDHALTRNGFLHLSAEHRHACRLRAGDRLLLVARPAERVLLLFTPHALDAMVGRYPVALPEGPLT